MDDFSNIFTATGVSTLQFLFSVGIISREPEITNLRSNFPGIFRLQKYFHSELKLQSNYCSREKILPSIFSRRVY